MAILGYTLKTIFMSLIDIALILMFIRSILSWVMPYPNGKLIIMLYRITDQLTAPMRRLLNRFEFVRSCPLDLSYLATCLVLIGIQSLLL